MRNIDEFDNFGDRSISENLSYHFDQNIGLFESVFRVES